MAIKVIANRKEATLRHTLAADCIAGEILVESGIVGYAPLAATAGTSIGLEYRHMNVTVPLAAGLGDLTDGTIMYLDESAGKFTNVSTDNIYAGPLRGAVLDNAATCDILLNP